MREVINIIAGVSFGLVCCFMLIIIPEKNRKISMWRSHAMKWRELHHRWLARGSYTGGLRNERDALEDEMQRYLDDLE